MIAPMDSQIPEKGTLIEAPWSAQVTIREVLLTIDVGGLTFYGVIAETQDGEPWDWMRSECLLWVFNDRTGFRRWQDTCQPLGFSSQETESKFDRIVGHYETSDGECFLAVQWKDRPCPTWEPERDMTTCANAVTSYFLRAIASRDETLG
ncbi:hypothetical protein FALBO_2493 [Fusarium albosuccineum]|uniref:Chromo domain-containing protein n=1 Tax=Fusarium albosuccineum TaxID=1237068 RepID=A0A8H4LNE7_9HYPO|nr:hypothetical protein FALBO_2493 [Fusarium albosuccineum]